MHIIFYLFIIILVIKLYYNYNLENFNETIINVSETIPSFGYLDNISYYPYWYPSYVYNPYYYFSNPYVYYSWNSHHYPNRVYHSGGHKFNRYHRKHRHH